MRYINGELPIKSIQAGWYDMARNGKCFDESWIEPSNFNIHDLMLALTEGEEGSTRVFVNLVDGRIYEIVLKDVTNNNLSDFNG